MISDLIIGMNESLRFTAEMAEEAYHDWGFNCGPASLCAMLDLAPDEVRPFLPGFQARGYVNPTMMQQALTLLGLDWRQTYRSDDPFWARSLPHGFGARGVVRVQFGGPWTRPGVPMRVRYRHTHWAAFDGEFVFDVNHHGWLTRPRWAGWLLPRIIGTIPRADGRWWPTHVVEVPKAS